MNINEITGGHPLGSAASLKALTNPAQSPAGSSSRSGISSDSVDTSVFSKLMQRGARELRDHLQPRPEKTAEWAGKLNDPLDMSDAVIHTVMRHMVGA
ncbi:MAG: hypothetical protein PHP44_00425 [Kiritimatiellae bacterium]|nr:hypothetical protein [Kiritimatiellia bacterium]MDD4734548.1 hypothetical protein [Kiritimatiellia bacterium]